MIGWSGLYEYAVDSAWRIGSTKGFLGSVITVVPSYNSGFSLTFPTISLDLIRFDELVTTNVCYIQKKKQKINNSKTYFRSKIIVCRLFSIVYEPIDKIFQII